MNLFIKGEYGHVMTITPRRVEGKARNPVRYRDSRHRGR